MVCLARKVILRSFAELLVKVMVVQLVMKFALYMGPEI